MNRPKVCPYCLGEGVKQSTNYVGMTYTVICAACGGSGIDDPSARDTLLFNLGVKQGIKTADTKLLAYIAKLKEETAHVQE